MIAAARQSPAAEVVAAAPEGSGRTLPHVSIHLFAETAATATAFAAFAADRRLARAATDAAVGGVSGAIARYRAAASPALIVVECSLGGDAMALELDRLAEVCEAGTRVVVVGPHNDIRLYRQLIDSGVDEYLLTPLDPLALVAAAQKLFCDPAAAPLGRAVAFIGAKGGVGSSAVAQNVAHGLAGRGGAVLLADFDVSFGAAAVSCNVEINRGLGDALRDLQRLDAGLLEGLMAPRGRNLFLLAPKCPLELGSDLPVDALEQFLAVARGAMPSVVLDLPHSWSGWVQGALRAADDIVLTATPTLACLRNAAAIIEALAALRPNDAPPHLVLNLVGAARREEAPMREIVATLKLEPACVLGFEPRVFGEAEARGLMLAETGGAKRPLREIEGLAARLSGGRPAAEAPRPLWRRLLGRRPRIR